MDDVTYVRDAEVCMQSMICYIPGCIYCGSENFGLGSVHDAGLAVLLERAKAGIREYRATLLSDSS